MDKPKKGDRLTDTDAEIILALSRNGMCVQRAADELKYTRTAVDYHLRKIHRVTGLNPKGFFELGELVEIANSMEENDVYIQKEAECGLRGDTEMNTCENCIHADVCKMWWYDAEGGCPHKKTESDALHTLRLIYSDFMEGQNRRRTRAEQSSMRGQVLNAEYLRRDSEMLSACASRVKYYCRRIGFDPSGKGE